MPLNILEFLLPSPGFETSDALVAVWWCVTTGLLLAAAWRGARALFPDDAALEALAHTIVLAWGAIVIAAIALGLAGWLSGPMLLLTVGGLALGGLLGLRSTPHAPRLTPHAWHLAWAILAAFWLGHVVTSGLLKFPTDWDSLNYHIPMIVQWLHARSLYAPDGMHWSNPGNNELLGLWLVAPFSGDFLIGLNNLPAAVLLACSAVGLGRQLGLTHALAHLAGLAIVSNYVVLKQLTDAENDVAAAGLFLACLMDGLRFLRQRRPASLVLCALSLGLLAGVKFYALGYAGLAGLVFVGVSTLSPLSPAAGERGWGEGIRRGLATAGVLLLGSLLFGGYWYMRNTWITGSPLYPKAFTAEDDVMTRIYPELATTSFLGNRRPELPALALRAVWMMAGPCHLAALLAVPLSLAWLLATGWRHRHAPDGDGLTRLAVAALLAGAGLLLLITPLAVEDEPGTLNQMHWYYCPVRYGLCFLSLAVLVLTLLFQDISSWLRKFSALGSYTPHFLLAAGALLQLVLAARLTVIEPANSVLIASNLLLLAALLALILSLRPDLRRGAALLLPIICLAGAAWGCDVLAQRWHGGFVARYDRMLDGGLGRLLAAAPGGARIAVLVQRCYPFFGSTRQYRMCQPVYVPSARWLRNYLRDQEISFVAYRFKRSSSGWQLFLHIEELLARCPDVLEPLDRQSDLIVASVREGGWEACAP